MVLCCFFFLLLQKLYCEDDVLFSEVVHEFERTIFDDDVGMVDSGSSNEGLKISENFDEEGDCNKEYPEIRAE